MTDRVIVIQNNDFEIEFQATDPREPESDELQSVMHIHQLTPYTMLLCSLGACTSIVLHSYAQNHAVDLQEVEVQLQYRRDFQDDRNDADPSGIKDEKIEQALILRGNFDDKDREKLYQVARHCSIHKMLEAGIEIISQSEEQGEKNMSSLKEMKCVPCQGDEPTVTEDEIAEFKPKVPDWQIIEKDDEKRLQRVFKFDNFASALAFTNKVGKIAEEQDHHPVLVTEWGKVTVTWWTHKIVGLHRNDFIMAAKTDDQFSSS